MLRLVWLISFVLFTAECAKDNANNANSTKKKVKVLFIGNSLTYTHDIPNTLKALADSSTDYSVEVDSLTAGGQEVLYFLSGGGSSLAYQKIMSSEWDFVVLQQQSIAQENYINPDYLVRESDRSFYSSLSDPEDTSDWCKTKRDTVLCAYERMIRAQKAEPVFYMHWIPYLSTSLGIASGGSFIFAAQKLNAIIAPVGLSFYRLQERGYASASSSFNCSTAECILEDNVHPGPLGAYAAACMFYATLTHSSPVGLTPLQGLSRSAAEEVQRVVWDTYVAARDGLFQFTDTYSVFNGSSSQFDEQTNGPTSIPQCLSGTQLEYIEDRKKNFYSTIVNDLHDYLGALAGQSSGVSQCYHF